MLRFIRLCVRPSVRLSVSLSVYTPYVTSSKSVHFTVIRVPYNTNRKPHA